MKRILTILTITITLTLTLTAQTARQLRVYLASGVVDKMALSSGSSLYHSRLDLDGVEHDDYVSLVIADGDGERRYMLSQVDSLVMPNGRRVVFQGSMTVQPSEARLVTEDSEDSNANGGPLRSSFSGHFPGQGQGNVTFYWTENDRIRLDVGYESRASQLTTDKTGAQFVFDSADLDAASYTVYYPGKSVTVLSEQTQTGADNSDHIGPSGDCGTATAMLNDNDNGTYSFTLEHKAAYLCFLPHIDYLPSVRIDKIVLTCNNAIAGTYQLASGGLYNSSATSNTITLNLVPQKEKDFFLGHSISTEQDSCAAYMVIAPQDASRSFTATYYLTDTLSHISKVYRQTFSFQPLANTVYPVTCNIRDTEFRTIDLGLSCNWSNVNVNATEPSLKGSDFDSEEEANAALLAQTIVTEWLMPDEDQKEEILEKCDWTWGTYNGKTGYLVTGAAAAKEYGTKLRIFIPSETHVTPAECLAQNYRPVEALMVDLGLPSKTKWAARNIGANSAEDCGYYYAFGEVETKTSYTSGNYKYGTQNLGDNFDISGTQNDAAVVNWGGIWRMPTKTEMEELMNSSYCQWTWTTINGMKGYIIASKAEGNVNRIFLPAAGFMKNSGQSFYSSGGSYATSTQGDDRSNYAYTLGWNMNRDSGERYLRSDNTWHPFNDWDDAAARWWGRTIRPVAAPNAVAPDGSALNIVTDSATWKLGDTSATLYGTLSSSTPIKNNVTVGFVVGDSANIVRNHCRFEYEQTVSVAGPFSQVQSVYDNIGYWYRAFIDTGDTIFYGKARHYGYEMVDLGLSVKWANMNLGADSPEDFGNYYAWGETTVKSNYSSSSYRYGTSQNLGEDLDIGETDNDAVHVHMGNAWRMPNRWEMAELMDTDNCTWTWTSLNNVNGYRVTSKKNGNSIFLPAAGFMKNSSSVFTIIGGSYATSTQGGDRSSYAYTLGWNMNRESGTWYLRNDNTWSPFNDWDDAAARWWGRTIRAVAVPNGSGIDGMVLNIRTDSTTWKWGDSTAMLYGTLSSTTPLTESVKVGFVIGDNDSVTINNARYKYTKEVAEAGRFSYQQPVYDNIGYWCRAYVETADTVCYGKARHYGLEMVDLGLSVLWANMNVGASTPEDFGDYYAWGETETKSSYTSESYQYGALNIGNGTDGNVHIDETSHDVAHVFMGNAWRMPTKTEMQELMNTDNCTWTWTSQHNVNGYRVTSKKNGNSIFLPAAGFMKGASCVFSTIGGSYFSAHEGGDRSNYAYTLGWNMNRESGTWYLRNDNTWSPFNDWDDAAARWWGRSIRAVARPNATVADSTLVMNIVTDSATWKLGDTSAAIYGTVSSTTPLPEGTKVGFVWGNSAIVEKGTSVGLYTKATTDYGSFSYTLSGIINNMGYWYRAYVESPDGEVFYGTARYVGWEMVDLGLSVKWANMNVGASTPEDYGDYYAWGETHTKSDTYAYGTTILGNNGNIAGTMTYDAACANMNSNWYMPTYEQMSELRNSCTWVWTTLNDVNGYKVTATNGNSIFLPAAGLMFSSPWNTNNGGSYYLANLNTKNPSYAYTLSWNGKSNLGIYNTDSWSPFSNDNTYAALRSYGRSVRAVANQ